MSLSTRAVRLAFALLASTAVLAVTGCGPDSGELVNIRVVNATSAAIRVDIDGPSFPNFGISLNPNGQYTDEVEGHEGETLTFTVTDPAGVRTTATGGCAASAEIIVPGLQYGQVNILENGNSYTVQCSSGWQ